MYSSYSSELGDLGTWYEDLLQTGTALYQKYTAIKDIKKQKKELEDYNRAMTEARAAEAQFRAQQAAIAKPKPAAATLPIVGRVDTTTMIIGGLVIGGAVLLLMRR